MFTLSILCLIMYWNFKENLHVIYYYKGEGLIEHTASWWVNNFSMSLFVSHEWGVYDVIQWKASSQD